MRHVHERGRDCGRARVRDRVHDRVHDRVGGPDLDPCGHYADQNHSLHRRSWGHGHGARCHDRGRDCDRGHGRGGASGADGVAELPRLSYRSSYRDCHEQVSLVTYPPQDSEHHYILTTAKVCSLFSAMVGMNSACGGSCSVVGAPLRHGRHRDFGSGSLRSGYANACRRIVANAQTSAIVREIGYGYGYVAAEA